MEQIAAFVLGVIIALVMSLIIVGVLMAFRTANLAKQNEKHIRNVEEWISRNDELVNRRIDQEIERVNQIANDCIRHTDSRVDKLDTKFCSDGRQLTEKSREFLKG
jgi:hypothetical protein